MWKTSKPVVRIHLPPGRSTVILALRTKRRSENQTGFLHNGDLDMCWIQKLEEEINLEGVLTTLEWRCCKHYSSYLIHVTSYCVEQVYCTIVTRPGDSGRVVFSRAMICVVFAVEWCPSLRLSRHILDRQCQLIYNISRHFSADIDIIILTSFSDHNRENETE